MRRKIGMQRAPQEFLGLAQIHAGVMFDVCLGNRHPSHARLVRKIRQPDQPVRVQTAHVAQLVFVLPRGLISIEDQRVGGSVFGVSEFGQLVRDAGLANRRLFRNHVAEGHAVVEGAHFDRHFAAGGIFEIRAHAVVMVAHFARFADGKRVGVVGALWLLAGLAHADAESRLPDELQPQPGRDKQRLAVKVDGVAKVVITALPAAL